MDGKLKATGFEERPENDVVADGREGWENMTAVKL